MLVNVMGLKFPAKVSKMGDKRVIVIPKEFHDEIDKMRGKTNMVHIFALNEQEE